jgi:type IV pilus assembly protein PilV
MNLHQAHPSSDVPERQKGFTLIEVMIALGILAFGILAIASMQTASLSGTSLAGNTTEATTVAMDRIEQLIARPYSHADLVNGNHGPLTQNGHIITWVVTDNQPLTNTKTIRVSVQWQEKGASKSSTLSYMKMDVI